MSPRKKSLSHQDSLRLVAGMVRETADAIITKDRHCRVTSWNKGAEQLFGFRSQEIIGRSAERLVPPDRHAEEAIKHREVYSGQSVDPYETVRLTKGGLPVEVLVTLAPLKDRSGRIVGAFKIARDISARRRRREHQSLLLQEMNHRVKNLFSVVDSLITIGAKSSETPQDLARCLHERVGALARTYTLGIMRPEIAANENDAISSLHRLIRAILFPYNTDGRISVGGADLPIAGNVLTALALILNELATNAAKYGALSASEGRLSVDCALVASGLVVTWREVAGRPVDSDTGKEGFGSVLLNSLVRQLGGTLARDWDSGLTVTLTLPRTCLEAGKQ
jgi:PAS domain S-box-containing protein